VATGSNALTGEMISVNGEERIIQNKGFREIVVFDMLVLIYIGSKNMAIWQYDIYLYRKIKKSWHIEDIECYLECVIDCFSIKSTWSDNVVCYGDYDSTCIALIYNGENIDEIKIRFDLRTLTKDQFNILFKFIINLDALVEAEYGELEIDNLKEEQLMNLLKNSTEYKFLKNKNLV